MSSSSDPTEPLREFFRKERQSSAQHPPPERIAAYHERRLSPEEMESLRTHLAACPDCTAELLGLADLLDGDAADGGLAPELPRAEIDAAWQRQRQRLFPGAPAPFPDRRKVDARPLRRAWAAATSLGLAAALLAAVVVVQWQTITRLKQPQVNPPLVNLVPVGSVRQGLQAIPELRLPQNAERAWVILNPEGDLDFSSYDAELRAPDGRVLLRLRDLRSSEAANFRLEVPRALLGEGEHRIVLIGKKGGQSRIVEEFAFRVRASATIGAS
ncbi:MAG TPA: zf-HC2 domain-containing protein [Thermoanaerobaculia bacterium]